MTDDLTAAVARLREQADLVGVGDIVSTVLARRTDLRLVLDALAAAQASEKIAKGCHGIAVRQRDSAWRECESLRAALEAAQADASDAFLRGYNRGLRHAEERAVAQSSPAADPLSHAWKSGYAQAKEESALEQQFCPHCNPCCGDGNDKCRKPAADPIADLARRLRALRIVDEVHSDNPLGRDAADALERQAREIAGQQLTIDALRKGWSHAQAERDALRTIVRAADAMRRAETGVELAGATVAYDRARAARKGEA